MLEPVTITKAVSFAGPDKALSDRQQYSYSILEFALAKEINYVPAKIKSGSEITLVERFRIVKNIVQIAEKIHLQSQVLLKAVNILDRALAIEDFLLQCQDILGIACLLISQKRQSSKSIKIELYLRSNQKLSDQHKRVIEMEGRILMLIDFDIGYISPIEILDCAQISSKLPPKTITKIIEVLKQIIPFPQIRNFKSSTIALSLIEFEHPGTLIPWNIGQQTCQEIQDLLLKIRNIYFIQDKPLPYLCKKPKN